MRGQYVIDDIGVGREFSAAQPDADSALGARNGLGRGDDEVC
jgi:hypothetical protein